AYLSLATARFPLLLQGYDVSESGIMPDAPPQPLFVTTRWSVVLAAQDKSSPDSAAAKRVSRAVEKIRTLAAKRGVTVGASGFVVVISANAVQAAPVGLAQSVTVATMATGAMQSAS